MKIKVGDKVRVITGKDKGRDGVVLKTLRKNDKVVVEGINVVKKHMKPSQQNETGGIISVENPIHVSNVKLVETTKKEAKPTKSEAKLEKTETKTKTTKKKETK